MVTLEEVKDVTDAIVKTIHPLSVQLFGSVAKAGAGNDLDLLIIIDDNKCTAINARLKVQKSLKKFYKKFAIDPFVVPLSSFNEHYLKGSPFLSMIFKEGRLLYMKDSVKEWLKQAEEEFKMASYLLTGGYFRGVCYHAQQSIEKTIKTMLLKKGWELEKTHSIERLVSICEDYNIKVKMSEDEMLFMDSVYRARYPADIGLLPYGEPSVKDAEKAVNIAERVLKNSKTVLKRK